MLGVKSDANLKKDTCGRISYCLRVVLMDFNVDRVVFRKIVIISASYVGYHPRGLKCMRITKI